MESAHLEPTPPSGPALAPITACERIVAIDVVRGFALLGILLVNMAFFAAPFQVVLLDTPWWPDLPDRVAEAAIRALAEGKFYVLFSLLFGLGMALQMQRAAEHGRRIVGQAPQAETAVGYARVERHDTFAGYYVRRLLVLLAIGLAHALLLWYGDILTAYALLGFLLLAFRRVSDKALLIWAAVIYTLPIVLFGALTALFALARCIPRANAQLDQAFAQQELVSQMAAAAAVKAYAYGSWTDIFWQRLADLATLSFGYIAIAPVIAAMFLLGLYVGRRRILHEPEAHLPLLRGLAYVGLPLGLACNVGFTLLSEFTSRVEPTILRWTAYAVYSVGAPLLAGGYAASLVLLLRSPRCRPRLLPLAAVGRMALTNYLLQTVICTTLFYSYGFGLFRGLSPIYYAPLALFIYLVQIQFSEWWLSRFRFGPLEWLWRTLTYGRPQPFYRSPDAPPA